MGIGPIDSEEKAKAKINELWESEYVYVILSETKLENNASTPRVFKIGNGAMCISLFTDYNLAKAFYIKGFGAKKKPLIGRIDKKQQYKDLYSVVNAAIFLGIYSADIDDGSEEVINMHLPTMLSWVGREATKPKMLMTRAQLDEMLANGGKTKFDFDKFPLYDPEA